MLPNRSTLPCLSVGLLLLAAAAPPVAAQTGSLSDRLKALNTITGRDVVDGEYQKLSGDKAAGELIREAADAVAKDKDALSYNAALVLGKAAGKLDKLDEAEKLLLVCTRKAAELESTNKLQESYGTLIFLLYDAKRYDECAKVCKQLLELEPNTARERIVIETYQPAFSEEPSFKEAQDFNSAAELKLGVHRILIQTILRQGKGEKALEMVDTLVKADDNIVTREMKAQVLYELGKYKDAAEGYEYVLAEVLRNRQIPEGAREEKEDLYRGVLSTIYVDLGEVKKAVEQLRSLVARHPNEPRWYNDLGYIMADHGMNLEEAEKLVRKALELDRKLREEAPDLPEELKDRDNAAYLDSLGWVLYKQKNYKQAREWLEKATKYEEGRDLEILDHLGDVYLELGERQQAVQTWRQALEQATDSARHRRRAEEVRKKIEKHSK